MYQVVTKLCLPFSLSVVVLGVSLVWLWRTKPSRRRPLTLAIAAYVLLILASFNPVTHVVLGGLEDQSSPLVAPPADAPAIVVLGGGANSLARCVRAAELYRPAVHTLVLASGGRASEFDPVESEQMKSWLVRMGVPDGRIVVDSLSLSTFENAKNCADVLRARSIERVVLVTDAAHIPRAAACFRKQGIAVVPGPCDRITDNRPHVAEYYVPSTHAAARLEGAVREWLGLAWYWVCGRI